MAFAVEVIQAVQASLGPFPWEQVAARANTTVVSIARTAQGSSCRAFSPVAPSSPVLDSSLAAAMRHSYSSVHPMALQLPFTSVASACQRLAHPRHRRLSFPRP